VIDLMYRFDVFFVDLESARRAHNLMDEY